MPAECEPGKTYSWSGEIPFFKPAEGPAEIRILDPKQVAAVLVGRTSHLNVGAVWPPR